jgi:aminopeptidase N
VPGGAPPPPTLGDTIDRVFARQPEIIDFLSEQFGPYPFLAAGGIVDDAPLGFALENQTRPIYSTGFFSSEESGASVVVHELAHQWFGDSVAVAAWQHIWLNEGFATYAEWLWSEAEGGAPAQAYFDGTYRGFFDLPEFWDLQIGDPGPGNLFAFQVYERGAMTLHELRHTVGDEAFFSIVQTWAETKEDGNATTDEFIALAEEISGQDLSDFFQMWLFGTERPTSITYDPEAVSGLDASALATAGPTVHGLGSGSDGSTVEEARR